MVRVFHALASVATSKWRCPTNQAKPGTDFTVTIHHKLPAKLGEQKFHVTLKNAAGKRVERIVKSASGTGTLEVTFNLPSAFDSNAVLVSAFVGAEYTANLLHRTVGPVTVVR